MGFSEPSRPRSLRRREQASNRVEQPRIGRGDTSGPSVQGFLIDVNHPLESLEAVDSPASDGSSRARRRGQDVEHEARLAASGYARHRGQDAGRSAGDAGRAHAKGGNRRQGRAEGGEGESGKSVGEEASGNCSEGGASALESKISEEEVVESVK